jgi:hypothetical protein
MRLSFLADDKAKSFMKVEECRIDRQDLQGERYALAMRLCQNCLDNRRSQTVQQLFRQNLKIGDEQCTDTPLQRKNNHISLIYDYNV